MSTETTQTKPPHIIISAIIAALDDVQARAQTRCLGNHDVESFAADVRRARLIAKRVGLTDKAVDVRYHGGAVPNSYRYRAEASYLEYSGGRLHVYRGDAVKASHGLSDETRVRLHIGKLADLPDGVEAALRRSRSVKSLHGGYAYL
jgi:hypothetical protein